MLHSTHSHGRAAEELACQIYQKAKFQILERNYRFGAYEVDLIAQRGNVIHFIEVKYRKTISFANLALNQGQFHRIAKAANHYVQDRSEWIQIDAFLVDHKLHWERIANIMLS